MKYKCLGVCEIMTSSAEESLKVVVFDRNGKQLREFKPEIPPGTKNNLTHLIQAVKSLQKETNDFLTELVCQEKSQNNMNDHGDQNVDESEEDKDEDSEDDDNADYSGSKFKKKRKI